jgi:hypothetical protein
MSTTTNDDVAILRNYLNAHHRTDWQLSDEQLADAADRGRMEAQASGWSWKVCAGKALKAAHGAPANDEHPLIRMPRRLDGR